MRRIILFEEQEVSAPRRKRKSTQDSPAEEQIRRMVDVKVGEFSAEIPESALSTVISFIREILMAEMKTEDVIELIITQVKESGKTADEVEKIRKILNAINDKFDPEFVNKIPSTFPFLAAVDKSSFSLSELDPDSLSLLNFSKKQIGRGEVAIPLLFGIDTFVAAGDEDENRKGTKTYDLVYNGKTADIKDFRTETGGKLRLTNELRLGGPASGLFVTKANEGFDGSSIRFLRSLRADDFSGQAEGAAKIINAFKAVLAKMSLNKLKLMTQRDIKKEIVEDAVSEVVSILDKAARDTIEEKYGGGLFVINDEAIKVITSEGFSFKRLPGGATNARLVVAPENLNLFKNGLQKEITQRLDTLYDYIEGKTGKPADTGEIQDIGQGKQAPKGEQSQEPDTEPVEATPDVEPEPQEQPIAEMLLRRLIRSL